MEEVEVYAESRQREALGQQSQSISIVAPVGVIAVPGQVEQILRPGRWQAALKGQCRWQDHGNTRPHEGRYIGVPVPILIGWFEEQALLVKSEEVLVDHLDWKQSRQRIGAEESIHQHLQRRRRHEEAMGVQVDLLLLAVDRGLGILYMR
jgi:hypothetical protein